MLARALAPDLLPHPGAVVLRSDVERKALFGVAETDRLPAEAYAPDVTVRTYAALADKARRIIAAGHSAIVDAVFSDAAERDAVAAVARANGVAFAGLFLTADLATRIARIGHRTGDASDADAAVARASGGLCAGLARLEHRRRLRHAGGDARTGEGVCWGGKMSYGAQRRPTSFQSRGGFKRPGIFLKEQPHAK